jgi:hypothetical protein
MGQFFHRSCLAIGQNENSIYFNPISCLNVLYQEVEHKLTLPMNSVLRCLLNNFNFDFTKEIQMVRIHLVVVMKKVKINVLNVMYTVVHQIAGRYQMACRQEKLTLERFGCNSK